MPLISISQVPWLIFNWFEGEENSTKRPTLHLLYQSYKDGMVSGFNSLVHSFRALSTLRRSGLRTASAAAKPCQGDSSEFYLITGILTVAAAGQKHINSQPHAHTSHP
ncbi:hypothetical protein Tco_0134499 [Tanacetum coccineum]